MIINLFILVLYFGVLFFIGWWSSKKIKDIKEPKDKSPNNVTNALFVGSTAELQKLLKKGKLDD